MSHVAYMSWVMSHTCHESCLVYAMSHVSHMSWVMSPIYHESCLVHVMSHVLYTSWVMSPICHESCLVYVMSHVSYTSWVTSPIYHESCLLHVMIHISYIMLPIKLTVRIDNTAHFAETLRFIVVIQVLISSTKSTGMLVVSKVWLVDGLTIALTLENFCQTHSDWKEPSQ